MKPDYEITTDGTMTYHNKQFVFGNGFDVSATNPKITKTRELSEDWRFTIADPSGNTIYVIQRKPDGSGTFFRDIDNKQYAKKFAILYDLVYSKQDMEMAGKVFSKLAPAKEHFSDLDKAKLFLIELEIYKRADIPDISF